MTFRRSLILSFAMHVLLFGTGLTFARYAGGLLRGRHEPIMVMLVDKGGSSATNGESRKTPTRSPDRSEQKSLPSPQEQPPEKASHISDDSSAQKDSDGRSVQQDSDGRSAQRDRAGEPGSEKGTSSDSGQAAAGSPSGPVSSEQWAVIVTSLERVKNYPRLARERGIEGVVRLRFRLKPHGGVDLVEIVKSSGYAILDAASVKTVYRAAPMPYVNGWVEVPMAYVLK